MVVAKVNNEMVKIEKRCPVCNKLHFKVSAPASESYVEIEVKCHRCKRLVKHLLKQ